MPTIYFNEYNVQMGAFSYLPLVSGLLQAYGETFPEIKENYTFMPFIYHMDEPAEDISTIHEAAGHCGFFIGDVERAVELPHRPLHQGEIP